MRLVPQHMERAVQQLRKPSVQRSSQIAYPSPPTTILPPQAPTQSYESRWFIYQNWLNQSMMSHSSSAINCPPCLSASALNIGTEGATQCSDNCITSLLRQLCHIRQRCHLKQSCHRGPELSDLQSGYPAPKRSAQALPRVHTNSHNASGRHRSPRQLHHSTK